MNRIGGLRPLQRGLSVEHHQITEHIIGAAYKVYNTMGGGFLESVYEQCMLIELRKRGVAVSNQHAIEVYYENALVGKFVADLLVADTVVVELKAVNRIAIIHEVQLVNYLTATGKDIGLILNFGEKAVQVRRKVRRLPGVCRETK